MDIEDAQTMPLGLTWETLARAGDGEVLLIETARGGGRGLRGVLGC